MKFIFSRMVIIFLFVSCFYSFGANSNIINLRVDTQMGSMIEIGIKKFGIAYESFNVGAFSITSNVNLTTQGARISYYIHPMGNDTWYFSLDGGQMKVTAATYSLFSGAQLSSGSAVGSYAGIGGGYHWFYWKTLNLNLGLIYISGSLNSLTTYNSSGAVVQTVNVPAFAGFGPELGIGISF